MNKPKVSAKALRAKKYHPKPKTSLILTREEAISAFALGRLKEVARTQAKKIAEWLKTHNRALLGLYLDEHDWQELSKEVGE